MRCDRFQIRMLGLFNMQGVVLATSLVAPVQATPPADPTVVEFNGTMHTQPFTQLGDPVTVALTDLREWATVGKNNPNDLRLFLAGRILPNNEPSLISLPQGYLNFQLNVEPGDRVLWVQILSEARRAGKHRIPISVGLKGSKQPFDSDVYVTLNVYPGYTPWVAFLLVLLFIGLIILGSSTPLLRDGANTSPYSLGRVQMACWFYLVIATYLYIWLITGDYNNLPASVLALIGISGGTGLAAIFVDQNKTQSANDQRTSLEAQQAALTARIAAIAAVAPPPGSSLDQELQQKRTSLHEATANLAKLPAAPGTPVSTGWYRDILRDGDGISFPRFQIAVWTIVLACIFIRAVYRDLSMPDFDASLLGLMGISAGTYVGFKFPETPKK
jgi:hypothetical protein